MLAQENYINETSSEIDSPINYHLIYDKDDITVWQGKRWSSNKCAQS